MSVMTYEAIVENGQIKLPYDVRLPERAKVFVVIPVADAPVPKRVASPRLLHHEHVAYFEKEVVEGEIDAQIR
ncbi:MAG: hypothetical protein ACKVZH_13925 [Blastocatellia bacterium]